MPFLYCHSIDIADRPNKVYIFLEAKRVLHPFSSCRKEWSHMCKCNEPLSQADEWPPDELGYQDILRFVSLIMQWMNIFNPFLSSIDQLVKKGVSNFQYHASYWNGTSSHRGYGQMDDGPHYGKVRLYEGYFKLEYQNSETPFFSYGS